MSRELWKVGVQWKDRRPEGTLRHSQIVVGYGPGALVDFVDDAAMIAGLSWWARRGRGGRGPAPLDAPPRRRATSR